MVPAFGGPKFRSLQVHAYASLTRAAIANVPQWPEWKRQLGIAAADALSLWHGAEGRCSPRFWDTEPIAVHLFRAY